MADVQFAPFHCFEEIIFTAAEITHLTVFILLLAINKLPLAVPSFDPLVPGRLPPRCVSFPHLSWRNMRLDAVGPIRSMVGDQAFGKISDNRSATRTAESRALPNRNTHKS
jgi:hypothetical protein